jgi:hypothetical protein
MPLEIDGKKRMWNNLGAQEYSEQFPASPKSLRKIAHALRKLGVNGEPFTISQKELAGLAGISGRVGVSRDRSG